jgi:hypothetical protein
MNSKNYKESGYTLDLSLLIKHLVLITCLISYEKWANCEK